MRAAVIVAVCLATLTGTSPSAFGAELGQREGPEFVVAVQWDAGTLLSWSPTSEQGAVYRVYRGTSIDDLVLIAKTSTPSYYDFKGDAGKTLVYAVTIVVDGQESKPTYREVHGRAACVSLSMDGSFVVRPYNCLPLA